MSLLHSLRLADPHEHIRAGYAAGSDGDTQGGDVELYLAPTPKRGGSLYERQWADVGWRAGE